jgi:hypothetical protein
MATKRIKLGSTAGPSADALWDAAQSVKTDGSPGTNGLNSGPLTVTLAGGQKKTVTLRSTPEGDLLAEFDA